MRVALHGKGISDEKCDIVREILKELSVEGFQLSLSESFKKELISNQIEVGEYETYSKERSDRFADFIISIGGDGTLLETVTHIGKKEIPILGINIGRLGFLATTTRDQISEISKSLKKREYTIDSRTLISLECDECLFGTNNFALNEFAILKKDSSSMIVVHAYLDGDYLNSYWADGLIVATPTGSTGYSLSCGGPVVLPQSHNFVITPVSPHNLSTRPLVVPDSSVISFEIEGRGENFLASLDSRSVTVTADYKLTVRKEEFEAKLIRIDEFTFVDTLRNKLSWGLDVRN
ncbi:MAG: NAD kinase [Bacteroidota bacterium]